MASWLEVWVPITAVAHILAGLCLLYALLSSKPELGASLRKPFSRKKQPLRGRLP
jgi:hypothetical protein